MDAAFRVLRYLKTTARQGLFLSSQGDLTLIVYCDAIWLSCHSTRRSCRGYFIDMGGSPVSWRTKKQSVVARSSVEAEYKAMVNTICEILWLRWLSCDLGAKHGGATTLLCDNNVARHIAANPVYHERIKHVEMDCYFVRERVTSGEIKVVAIKIEKQLAGGGGGGGGGWSCCLSLASMVESVGDLRGGGGVFGGSLFSVMHGSLVTSSLIKETTENESTNEGYRFGQEEETYNIVAAHCYFGRLIFQYASFNNSRSLHFFLIFTKALGAKQFHYLRGKLGVCNLHSPT
uniref:Reverse transcriptase Ty1/copia-type domain-containing protein n=1 Tax=Lactuca sativa TaxID=4236 RepID=A0A9R1WJL8_LACSA|nr:hypothetical protein LSAT_V11C100003050 [Lactuca sativa]